MTWFSKNHVFGPFLVISARWGFFLKNPANPILRKLTYRQKDGRKDGQTDPISSDPSSRGRESNKSSSIFISYLIVNQTWDFQNRTPQYHVSKRQVGTLKSFFQIFSSLNVEFVSCKNKIPLLPNLFSKYPTADNCFELFCIPLILLVIKVKQLALFIMLYQNFLWCLFY